MANTQERNKGVNFLMEVKLIYQMLMVYGYSKFACLYYHVQAKIITSSTFLIEYKTTFLQSVWFL